MSMSKVTDSQVRETVSGTLRRSIVDRLCLGTAAPVTWEDVIALIADAVTIDLDAVREELADEPRTDFGAGRDAPPGEEWNRSYHLCLNKLCKTFGVPGAQTFDEALAWIKERQRVVPTAASTSLTCPGCGVSCAIQEDTAVRFCGCGYLWARGSGWVQRHGADALVPSRALCPFRRFRPALCAHPSRPTSSMDCREAMADFPSDCPLRDGPVRVAMDPGAR